MAVVLAAVAVFCATYVFLDLNKLASLRYGADVGIFLQSLVDFARRGSTFDWAEHAPHLSVHDSWALLVFAPLVNLWPHPESLLVTGVLAVGAAAIPLYLLARAFGLARGPATMLALAYLLSPSVQGWAYGDFSENHFVPVLVLSLALAARRRSLWATLLCAQLLLGIKEDEAFFLAWFGAAAAVWYDRRLGLSVLALAACNAGAYYALDAAFGFHPSRPAYGLGDPLWPQQLAFFAEVLAPFAFAPLALGPRIALAAPLVVELCFAQNSYPLARAGTHYTEPLVALIAVGAVVAIASRPWLARYALVCSLVMALFFNHESVLHFGRTLFDPDPRYPALRALATTDRQLDYEIDDEGEWVVVAGDLNARLEHFGSPLRHPKPAWAKSWYK
jgi:uncharacterized membrane protein